MHTRPDVKDKLVKPGIYEIQSEMTGLYLNSVEDAVYNRWCDDTLTLDTRPSRRGKWEIIRVGDGYTVKQVQTGLYCALSGAEEEYLYQPVVLSSVPTVWTIEYLEESSQKVRIIWSVSDLCWENVPRSSEPEESKLIIRKPLNGFGDKHTTNLTWLLKPVGEAAVAGKVKPGLYSLQNKVSGTYVMMGPDEKTIGCWPQSAFKNNDTKLWEIAALGDGYTIRWHGTNKYCTLEDGLGRSAAVNVSNFPAAWSIVPNESALHSTEDYFQIYWGNTKLTWDLSGYGKSAPGTPIYLQTQNRYEECRLFRFVP